MDEKYIGRKISYRNDFFGEGTIKEVVVVGVDERYSSFAKVVDYPLNGKDLNERWVWFSGKQGKKEKENIKQSEDWCVGKEISRRERRRLNKILKRK